MLHTAHCFSPLPGFESQMGRARNLPVTLFQAVFFAGYSGFLDHLHVRLVANQGLIRLDMAEKITMIENQIQIQVDHGHCVFILFNELYCIFIDCNKKVILINYWLVYIYFSCLCAKMDFD